MRRAVLIVSLALASLGAFVTSSFGTTTQTVSLAGTPFHGSQCAPTTPSHSPRLRGTFAWGNTNQPVAGKPAYVYSLPTDTNTSTYPLEACDLVTPFTPLQIGASNYYGLMVYVPNGWTVPNHDQFGVMIEEYHFQNIYAAPLVLELHSDHVTLGIESGACYTHSTSQPGCAVRTDADHLCRTQSYYTCLGAQYAIPPGALQQGTWMEMVMHATWQTTSTGDVEIWFKAKGATAWTQSVSLSGIPTLQYDITKGTPPTQYTDLTEAYTQGVSAPMNVTLGNYVTGSSFSSVAGTMP